MEIKVGKKGTLPERLLLYGEKGIGKTTFASRAEGCIFIPTEDGCSSVDGLAQFELQSTYEGVLKCVAQLLNENHKYQTVVIDTADSLVSIISDEVMKRDFEDKPLKFNNFLAGNKVVTQELKRMLSGLDMLREKKKMRIILLAHSGILNKKNPDGNDYMKISGDMPKFTWGLLFGWVDRLGYAGYEFSVKGGNDAENQKGKVIQRDSNRYIWFGGNAAVEAKTRVGFELKADKVLFTYKDYKEAQ